MIACFVNHGLFLPLKAKAAKGKYGIQYALQYISHSWHLSVISGWSCLRHYVPNEVWWCPNCTCASATQVVLLIQQIQQPTPSRPGMGLCCVVIVTFKKTHGVVGVKGVCTINGPMGLYDLKAELCRQTILPLLFCGTRIILPTNGWTNGLSDVFSILPAISILLGY